MKPYDHDRDPMKSSDFDSLFRRDPTTLIPFSPSASLAERILDSMDVRVEAFAICRIAQDAALVVPAISDLKIMYVLKGTLHLSVEGSEPLVSSTDSIILLPKNLARTLSGQESTQRTFSVEEALHKGPHNLMYIDAFVGAEHEIRVLCGRIQIGLATDFDPFDGLVRPISAKPDNSTFVRSAFETMLDESRLRTAGSRILANTLMKACLVELLRHDLDQLHNPGSSSAILLKPRVGRAVIAIISQPSAAHTVASLAKTAGMSRSAFAKAFVEATGATPIEFLARARLAKARDLIVATERSIASIAVAVGFASRSHFSSRFRERYGEDPTAYRKRARQKQPAHGHLDETFIARQRERLLALRAQLIADGDAAAAEENVLQVAAGDEPRDAVDDSNRLEQQGNDEAILAHDLDRIAAVDRALMKIQEHTYGLSDGNGEPIGRARLEAVPEAIFTVDELNARARQG